ncbi:hypothetical protein M885DRAFT_467249, partial [Pelagophyceae sp. CCMP2097]
GDQGLDPVLCAAGVLARFLRVDRVPTGFSLCGSFCVKSPSVRGRVRPTWATWSACVVACKFGAPTRRRSVRGSG